MKLKENHKDKLILLGAVASIVGMGYLVWQHKQSATKAGINGDVTAMSTPIPIFSWSNIGGSQAPNGAMGGQHNIGTGNGVTPVSVNFLQPSGGGQNAYVDVRHDRIAAPVVE